MGRANPGPFLDAVPDPSGIGTSRDGSPNDFAQSSLRAGDDPAEAQANSPFGRSQGQVYVAQFGIRVPREGSKVRMPVNAYPCDARSSSQTEAWFLDRTASMAARNYRIRYTCCGTMQKAAAHDHARHHVHYLEAFPGSFVLIAPTKQTTRAVVFVHGFGGDSCGTWSHFQMLIDELDEFRAWFSTTDLFFFQYKSVWERIDSSVDRVLRFLDAMVPRPEEEHFLVVLNPILSEETIEMVRLSALPASRVYEELILVGHSEGGVVIRKAILD